MLLNMSLYFLKKLYLRIYVMLIVVAFGALTGFRLESPPAVKGLNMNQLMIFATIKISISSELLLLDLET